MPSSFNGEYDPDDYGEEDIFRREIAPYDYRPKLKKPEPKKRQNPMHLFDREKKKQKPDERVIVTGVRA